jgi:nucleotide-binding universal stress UspA family protein
MARPILHPTDFSSASGPAFRKAIELAKAGRKPLLILHVMAPPAIMTRDMYVSAQVYEALERSMRADAGKRLDRLVTRARDAGVKASGLLLEGASYEGIARAAKAKRAEMIVMGTHGRTGFTRMVLGSVASRVLAAAPCPVLTVRARS